MSKALPDRILHLPDGETGKRNKFTHWQNETFADSPHVLKSYKGYEVHQVSQEGETLADGIKMSAPGYDNIAVDSYAAFCRLRSERVIQQGVRFQVSLPTPMNVLGLCLFSEYQAAAEPMYEKAFLAGLRRIQDEIPAEDLAIQWDMAYEIGMLEFPLAFTPYFEGPIMQGVLGRVARLTEAVDEGVKMGFHLCYGDAGHKHFVEPKDIGVLVDMMNQISGVVKRKVNWFHVPVPKDRTDEAYFAPLKDLKLKSETEIYLGLAHAWDIEGTRSRIDVASRFLEDFGVATECGFGRTGRDEVENVLGVLASVTTPERDTTIPRP
jgi:methionine synthase II (cobalamin-independent)